jgi:hypothetical protein
VKLSARQYELLEALSIHLERVIAKADLARRAGVGSRWDQPHPRYPR